MKVFLLGNKIKVIKWNKMGISDFINLNHLIVKWTKIQLGVIILSSGK